MTDRLPAVALSRHDGSPGDGIHLAWALPGAAGLSVDGFTVQRRPAVPPPPQVCRTLTADELTALHRDHDLRLDTIVLTFRSAPCPAPVPVPPDDPHTDDPPPPRPVCRELGALVPGPRPNPLTVDGVTLTVQEPGGPPPASRVRDINGFRGLDMGTGVDVALPAPAGVVSVSGAHFAAPPRLLALDALGQVVDARTAPVPQSAEWTVLLTADAVTAVRIEVPDNEALLLRVCTNAYPSPPPAPDPPDPWGDGTVGCFTYTVELPRPHTRVSVRVTVPTALVVALRDGKAVGWVSGAGTVLAEFFGRPVDRIALTTSGRVTGLMVCAEPPVPEAAVEQEWASATTLVTGLQLPLRAADPALQVAADEAQRAASRLLPGETFPGPPFREVADLLGDCLAAAGSAPVTTMVTTLRDAPGGQGIDVHGWPMGQVLHADAAWRRMMGFGHVDPAAGLTAGSAYDYRVSARVRRRDLTERVLGFHTVPDGTTLPAMFQLAAIGIRTPGPAAVRRFPAGPADATRSTGRMGLPIDAAGPGQAVVLVLPAGTTRLVLEIEPALSAALAWTARSTPRWPGAPPATFAGPVPAQPRVELMFAEPVDRVRLTGSGLLYAVRVPVPAMVDDLGGDDPDDPVTVSTVLRGVVFAPTPRPAPPAVLGTVALQQPIGESDPATAPAPPTPIGFRVSWPVPPAGPAAPLWWPADLPAAPPTDVSGYVLEHRRVDTNEPFAERDGGTGLSTLVTANRATRDRIPSLAPGCDLTEVFPERPVVTPPVSALATFTDVLERGPGSAPPGSLHQYRVWSVDLIGRRSATAATGSVVRLEKWRPPPLPVAPDADAPDDANPARPRGVRARVLQATVAAELTADDRALLGNSTSAVVLQWGWTGEERRRDPWATEFRVYWQDRPPDAVTVELVGPALLVDGRWQMAATLDRAVPADAFAGRTVTSGGVAHRIYAHTGGLAATYLLEPSPVVAGAPPLPGRHRLRPVLRGGEQRPARWTERVAVVQLSAVTAYTFVIRDRLLPTAVDPLVTGWAGVSAADAQGYVPDEMLAPRPLAGRPGNESSVVPVSVSARYVGRPAFTPPPSLAQVPEVVLVVPAGAAEAGGEPVAVRLNLPSVLPGVAVPPGHGVQVERLALDDIAALLTVTGDDRLRVTPPAGAPFTYTLTAPADHAAILAQLRSGNVAQVESRFLLDALLAHQAEEAFEPLWVVRPPSPVAFGAFDDRLSVRAHRVVYRVRLVDQAGHVSQRGAVARRVVRVPSTRVPGTPRLALTPDATDAVTVDARMPEAFDVSHLLLFQHSTGLVAGAAFDVPPQLLVLPDRRGLAPGAGIRLRVPGAGLLAPVAVPVNAGTVTRAERAFTVTLPPVGLDRLALVWAAALTRDGVPSRVTGPVAGPTAPQPVATPVLAVTPGSATDRLTWSAPSAGSPAPAGFAVQRATGGGWTRVSPWLPETVTWADVDRPGGSAPRRYRLLARSTRGDLVLSNEVTTP